MLTTNKVLLVASGELIEQLTFEAIQQIVDISECSHVWDCNKIPIIMREFYEESNPSDITTLFVPEELRDLDDFITFSHANGFECGELIRSQRFDTTKDKCFLCNIANHTNSVTEFNITTKKVSDVIIYESTNFFVVIELGCMIPGMLIINPKSHYFSAARIPEDQLEEYFEVMRDSEIILKNTYGDLPVIFFEHGSAPTGFSSHAKSIVHAHTHVAINCKFDEKYLKMVQLRPISNIRELRKSKYMSYQCGSNGQLLVVNDPNVYVQRQYPRQVIGLMHGIPNEKTNWRIEPFIDNMNKTFRAILASLKNKENHYPERIIERTRGFVEGYPLRKTFTQ